MASYSLLNEELIELWHLFFVESRVDWPESRVDWPNIELWSTNNDIFGLVVRYTDAGPKI